jgi:protoporphyrinogen oxidase
MKKRVIILGGGVSGLSAGWMLARTGNYEVTVIESAPVTGGACGTFEYRKFLLDYGPHKAYSILPGILDELKNLMGDEFLKHEKRNSIFMFNSFLKYPVRMTDIALKMGAKNLVQCGLSAAAMLNRGAKTGDGKESYEEYVVNRFGRKLYRLVFEPLADKIWGDPSTLSADIARARIPGKSFLDVAMRAAGFKKDSELTDAKYFYYPRRGFGRILKRMEEEITKFGGTILTSTKPTKIERREYLITQLQVENNSNLNTLPCDLLISSIPLSVLAVLLGNAEEPCWKDTLHIVKKLQYRNAILVYVFLRQEVVTDHHWIFFPERDVIFSRIFEQKQMSREMCPKDKTVICCDFTDYENGNLWNHTDRELADKCVSDLERTGIIRKSWVEGSFIKRLPGFYPRYDLSYKRTLTTLYSSLKRVENLLLTGRIGFYNYNNSDHCVDMGRFIADNLECGKKPDQIWTELEQRVAEYKIVD